MYSDGSLSESKEPCRVRRRRSPPRTTRTGGRRRCGAIRCDVRNQLSRLLRRSGGHLRHPNPLLVRHEPRDFDDASKNFLTKTQVTPTVNINWYPGRQGIIGNEPAHELAKAAAETWGANETTTLTYVRRAAKARVLENSNDGRRSTPRADSLLHTMSAQHSNPRPTLPALSGARFTDDSSKAELESTMLSLCLQKSLDVNAAYDFRCKST
ncbi:hypothetical protein R3P38DRAFT_3155141 [Favolaschia claudopus]|uniref:RNase H type-1 domain-containing protein n=1 Tax=Favolaschia claudopus TaxID=2862362 RepID=A0AAV9YZP5_9AGAR